MERTTAETKLTPATGAQSVASDAAEALRDKAGATFDSAGAALVASALDAVMECLPDTSNTALHVADLLIDQHADATVTAATLLAPVEASGQMERSEIERVHGAEVAALVEEVRRVTVPRTGGEARLHDECADLLRSTAGDLRVLVARVATRIIDLEQPTAGDADNLRRLAQEGRDLLVPLADRIGLGSLRGRLEDACFRVLEPELYRSVDRSSAPIRQADDVCLDLLTRKVAGLLDRNGLDAEVQGRTKSLWGLLRKMRRHDLPVERIMDRLGARVIVASVPDCYAVLGILHRHFRPIPGTFDDYIGLPKENGYQSLHTCVYPLREISAKPVEFQIRTKAMHAEAEFGAAAHWLYRSREDGEAERARQRRWLEDLVSCHERTTDHEAFVAQLGRLVYEQSLVVFLRGGAQVRMPFGSTAADLVRKVSERPASIRSVVINASDKPLGTPLADGDTVEWGEDVPAYLYAQTGPHRRRSDDDALGSRRSWLGSPGGVS